MEITRRYSGGRLSLKDDFDIDFNDISRASTPMSTLSSKSEGRRRERTATHHHHSIDDYKRKVARLKSELEMEKARNKQVYREKTDEIKLLREAYEADRQREIDKMEKKLSLAKEKEVEILQQNISKKKDKELQQVLRYKEDELKSLSAKLIEEKEQHLKSLKEDEEKQYSENMRRMEEKVNIKPSKADDGVPSSLVMSELGGQVKMLKDERDAVKEELKKKQEEESKRTKEFSDMKDGYDAELRKIVNESKKLVIGNLQKLKKAEKALSEGGNMSNEDAEVNDISEMLDRMTPYTPFSEVSSRAASSVLGFKLEDLRLDDLRIEESDLEKLIASAKSPANVPSSCVTPFSLPSKSPAPSLVSPPPSEQEGSAETENRRLSDEKDRQLQKRVSELQTQTQRLERKISLLKSENDCLKKRHDEHRPLEEKIKILKKRNAELAAIARRLEEKAKHLQQENMKKVKDETGHQDTEQLKRMFARQRAKDLADHAKAMLAKDREIEDLRKKCQELADMLSNGEFLGPENVQMYEEKEELVSIIKQAAKERLQMEKQLAKMKPTATAQAEVKRLKELEITNESLQKEITRLEKAKEETEKLEIELAQKKIECEALNKEVLQEKANCKLLEGDLQESVTKNTQLTVQVSDLQRRLHQLEKVNEECNVLRLSLTEAQHECDLARNERNSLQSKVHDLESCVENLQSAAEKLSSLEHDYNTTKQQLQQKQADVILLQQTQDENKREHEDLVAALQIKVTELQQNCEKQEAKHQSLSQQLQNLQAANTKKPPLVHNWTGDINKGRNSSPNKNNNLNSSSRTPVTETFQQTHEGLVESASSGKLTNGHEGNQVDSTKSLDTGFADDDETELENSNVPSPEQGKGFQGQFEDPELYEISKKLKELEATDSEEEIVQSEDKGDDSGMECNREQKTNTELSINRNDAQEEKKIPVQVYFAKYSYDPFEHSPNENPDAELTINAGDYVLVHGEMDEDAFFDGEMLDGRRGLVPSNFVELVKDEDLPAFHAAMAGIVYPDDDHITPSNFAQDLDFDSSEETDDKPALIGTGRQDDLDIDLSRSPKALHTEIPYPWKLTLDRQLTNSILISWKSPIENTVKFEIKSYHIYVDGDFKAIVHSNERTKALVENVDSKTIHRVSVRCVSNLGQSDDSYCTILVGKDAVPVPSQLKATDITPNSACISWLPGNSNYQHSISANSCEICIVKPGIYNHILTGLDPAADYTVTVTAKSLTDDTREDNLSTSVVFKTPAGGLPDSPLNMQVEAGPQEGTLLLTWLPVTIDTSGFSNGAGVAGYVVYADGRRIKEAYGPTNDHIVLSAHDFQGFIPKELTVRTLTRDKNESMDSNLIKLPQTLIREITAEAAKTVATEAATKVLNMKQKSPIHRPGMVEQVKLDQAFREQPQEYDVAVSPILERSTYDAEEYIDSSSSSELSDIMEVEEEIVQSNLSSCASTPDQHRAISLDDLARSRSSYMKVKTEESSTSPHIKSPPTIKVEISPVQQMESSPMQRIVPAIEITRDSSSERGNSFEISEDETDSVAKSMRNGRATSDQRHSPPQHRNSPSIINKNNSSSYQRTSPTISEGKSSPTECQKSPEKHSDSIIAEGKVKKQIDKFNEIPNSDKTKSPVPGSVHKPDVEIENSKQKLDNRTSAKDSSKPVVTNSPKHHLPTDSPTQQLINNKHFTDHDSNANELISNETPVRRKHPDVPSLNLNDLSVDESVEVDSISGEINPPVEDTRVRLFVALFDYDPETMSPNVDAIDEELPFKEGQIIKIYGDKDLDGFYRGECNNRMGFVPCNMVSEVQVDDAELAEQLLKDSQDAYSSNSHLSVQDSQSFIKSLESLETTSENQGQNGLSPTATVTGPMRRMVALYDYDPQELSPNVDVEIELSFHNGDIILVFGEMDDDGFFMGEINGQRGLVPSNFLQEVPMSDEDVNEGTNIISPSRSGGSLSNLSESRQSDVGTDKTTNVATGVQLESLPNDWVDTSSQNHTPTRSCSVSPEDKQQKKRGSGILSKGKSIFKKFTR